MLRKSLDLVSDEQLFSLFKRPFQPSFIPVDNVALDVESPFVVSTKKLVFFFCITLFYFRKKPEELSNVPEISSRFLFIPEPSNEDKLEQLCLELSRNTMFSIFIPKHKKIAQKLMALFLGKHCVLMVSYSEPNYYISFLF